MTRTLEDMKRDRGGHCHQCGKDIMDASEKDHTFCNDCWYKMLMHRFEQDPDEGDDYCAQCGEGEDSPYHTKYNQYIADKMYRIAGLG